MKRSCNFKRMVLFICAFFVVFAVFGVYILRMEDVKKSERFVYTMSVAAEMTAYGKNGNKALEAAEAELKRLEAVFDRGDPESEVSALNVSGGGEISEDMAAVTETALRISRETDGAFDITIAPVMDLWGFFDNNFRVPSDDEISAALENVGYERMSTDGYVLYAGAGTRLDFGGVAKGYASDRVADIMRENGVDSAMINIGGNVYACGRRYDGEKWRVAIANPKEPSDTVGTIFVEDSAVITSGSYQRVFESGGVWYHHIIDPSDGYPADSGLSSVTVIDKSGTKADALSTAFFVMGLENSAEYLAEHSETNAVFIDENGGIYITAGIKDDFECEKAFYVLNDKSIE